MSDYLKGKRIVDPVLIGIVRGYENTVFIGGRIFPVALTDKEGVRIPTFRKTVFVGYDTERTVGTGSSVPVRKETGTLDLVLGGHDLAVPVDYCEQAESMFNKESKAIRHATNNANLRYELTAARLTQDEKIHCTGHVKKLTVSDRWTGGEKGPIGVIEAGIEAVRMATGLRPNLMTIGVSVVTPLKFHLAIQAAIGTNERKHITTEILQNLFQIEEIVIGAPASLPPIKATMDENSVPADVWGDSLILHYIDKPQPGADNADENEPSFGYTLRREGMPVTGRYSGAGGRVKYCRYTNIYKVAVVGGGAGYLITGISK